jgi:hypothetical protein
MYGLHTSVFRLEPRVGNAELAPRKEQLGGVPITAYVTAFPTLLNVPFQSLLLPLLSSQQQWSSPGI